MKLYGWVKNVAEAENVSQNQIEINICNKCVLAPFPLPIIYDGEEGNCIHLFALKAEKKLSQVTHDSRSKEVEE